MTEDDKKTLEVLFTNSKRFCLHDFFIDSLGGLLFEAITKLEEYTPQRMSCQFFKVEF